MIAYSKVSLSHIIIIRVQWCTFVPVGLQREDFKFKTPTKSQKVNSKQK